MLEHIKTIVTLLQTIVDHLPVSEKISANDIGVQPEEHPGLVECQGSCPACCRTAGLEDPAPEISETGTPATGTWHAPADPEGGAPRTYTDEEVVTLQEAENLMRCRRTKIYLLRRQGVLTTVKRGSEIRLIREDVEHNRQWR